MTERQALLAAGAAHLALIAALSIGFELNRREIPLPDAIVPVELVEIADTSRITKAAPKPTPPAPQPSAEPEPVPAPEPPPPVPAAKPEPKSVPKPEPKPVLKPEPRPKPAPAPKPERLDVAKLDSLLDKAAPKARPKPLDTSALAKSIDAALPKSRAKPLDTSALAKSIDSALPKATRADPRASASLLAAIRAQVLPCWNPPIGGADVAHMTVVIHVELARDGSVSGRPEVIAQTGRTAANDGYARAFAETARRAVLRCAPLKLPADLYDQWKSIDLNFDPTQLA